MRPVETMWRPATIAYSPRSSLARPAQRLNSTTFAGRYAALFLRPGFILPFLILTLSENAGWVSRMWPHCRHSSY